MTGRPALRALAERVGIARAWTDAAGTRHEVSVETLLVLCEALGLSARTERAARAERRRLEAARSANTIALGPGERCVLPADRTRAARRWGLLTNLYSVRSARNWGVGDLTDLGTMVEWTADHGGVFVGTNPLHAIRNRGADVSPYAPLSRLFRNWIYLDITEVPEWRVASALRRRVVSGPWGRRIETRRGANHLAYAELGDLKMGALKTLYDAFRTRRDAPRERAYRGYVQSADPALTDFATFVALEEHHGSPPTAWPAALRNPRSSAVARFRREHAARVDYHRWVQFELDRQMAAVARRARRLSVGLIGDLAIGAAANGSDPWMFPEVFVNGASLGAPPDAYAPEGQNWGLPPLDPLRLAETGFSYWLELLHATLRHMGGLRIDHVMGLYRQFWIPAGGTPADGTYVRFPGDALLALLCRESARLGAVVIGEDLGTVPRGLPRRLQRRGVLSTRMLYFQRDRRGTFHRTDTYPERALVSATTHDHAPVRGFLAGTDLRRRREAGALDDAALEAALAEREVTRRRLVNRLVRSGVLARADGESADAIVAAVHAFLARTPSTLLGVMHDDLAGERDPVNLPGVAQERYASWTRRMGRPLESLEGSQPAPAILRALKPRSAKRGG